MDIVITLDVTENKAHQNMDDIKIILFSKTRLYESQTKQLRSGQRPKYKGSVSSMPSSPCRLTSGCERTSQEILRYH